MSEKLKLQKGGAAGPPPIPPAEKDPFSAESQPATSEQQPPVSVGQSRRILVVDDNPVVLKAFEIKLKASGFAVSTTTNADEVASAADRARADLIILDVNFPAVRAPGMGEVWNGFMVMQWLRRFPNLANVPVIIITGTDSTAFREKALAEGAAAFFQKPVAYPELLEAMLRALGIRE
jgi:CheY-like chemotaxis protein